MDLVILRRAFADERDTMICTFAGHREIFGFNQSHLMEILESILESEQELICYVGGMGEFDSLCANAVRVLKHRHPEKNILLILVLPYMKQAINTRREYYQERYDDIIIPTELAGIHYKRAILARNRWMVDQADYVVAMVWRNYGGAFQTLKYAERLGKKIFRIEPKQ